MQGLSDEEFAAVVDRDLVDDLGGDERTLLRAPENQHRWFTALLEVEARVSRQADALMQGLINGVSQPEQEIRSALDAYRRTLRVERKVRRRLIEVLFLIHESTKTA